MSRNIILNSRKGSLGLVLTVIWLKRNVETRKEYLEMRGLILFDRILEGRKALITFSSQSGKSQHRMTRQPISISSQQWNKEKSENSSTTHSQVLSGFRSTIFTQFPIFSQTICELQRIPSTTLSKTLLSLSLRSLSRMDSMNLPAAGFLPIDIIANERWGKYLLSTLFLFNSIHTVSNREQIRNTLAWGILLLDKRFFTFSQYLGSKHTAFGSLFSSLSRELKNLCFSTLLHSSTKVVSRTKSINSSLIPFSRP